MMKRIAAVIALCTLFLGYLSISPAQAHQGNIKITKTECVSGNSMSATYTVGWTNGTATGKLYTKLGLLGSLNTSTSGWDFEKNVSGASGSAAFTKTHSFTGSNGPWVSFKIVFSDNYVVGGDTRVEGFDWDKCKPTQPDPKKHTESMQTCDDGGYSATREGTEAYKWNGSEWALSGTVKWGDWKRTPYTDDEFRDKCASDNPGPKYSEWSSWTDEQPTCEVISVTQTRTRTKTTYKWDTTAREYVVDGVTTETDSRTVTMTDDDYFALCAPIRPEPKVHKDADESCEIGGFKTRNGTEAYVWNTTEREWKLSGIIEWAEWTFTAYSDDEFFTNCAPTKPETKVVLSEWGDWAGEPTCEAPTITQVRERTRTETTYTWNANTRVWDGSTTVTTETETRNVTISVTLCKPDPKVDLVFSEWVDGKFKCNDTKVTQTRYRATWEIPYILNESQDEWVLDYDHPTLIDNAKETDTRKLSADERTVCPVPGTNERLAKTGVAEDAPLFFGFGALLIVLGGALTKRYSKN